MSWMNNEQFIICTALLLCMLLFGRKIYLIIISYLDKNIIQISNKLEESKKKLLSSSNNLYIKKEELDTLLYNKKKSIENIESKIEHYYEKRIEHLQIKLEHQKIILNTYLDNIYFASIRDRHKNMIDIIITTTKTMIQEEMTYEIHQAYITQAISEIKDIVEYEQ